MKRSPFFLLPLIVLALAPVSLVAQNGQPNNTPSEPSTPSDDDGDSPGPRSLWQAKMAKGHYLVKHGNIASIAKHEYISDGAARVFEVTILTNTSGVARFYYLEPVTDSSPLAIGQAALNRTKELVEEAAGRAGVDDDLYAVVKNYPTTTHAHTVEFRLAELSHLDSLYRSIHRTLETQRGVVWTDPSKQ